MAKPFNKSPWKWLELPSTKEYIRALSENRSLAENQLVTSVREATEQKRTSLNTSTLANENIKLKRRGKIKIE